MMAIAVSTRNFQAHVTDPRKQIYHVHAESLDKPETMLYNIHAAPAWRGVAEEVTRGMNATRRKTLNQVLDALETTRIELATLRDQEQECFDNLPESLQSAERGERMEECIGELDELIEAIDTDPLREY